MFEQKQPWIIRLVRYIYVKIRGWSRIRSLGRMKAVEQSQK
jgi:hypothetical protein